MTQAPVFRDIQKDVDEDGDGPQVSEMESLCLNCRKDGTTRLLFTKIPFFKEVVIMSFDCPHCHWVNNELQPAGLIQEKGVNYRVKCTKMEDLNRQEIMIPEIEFEVTKQTGLITNIEGLLDRTVDGLRETIRNIQTTDPENVLKLADFIKQVEELKEMKTPFTFILDDPTGNSFVENPLAPEPDPNMEVTNYVRTLQQNKVIGIVADDEPELNTIPELQGDPKELIKGEVLEFPTNCPSCNVPCLTNMKVTAIPHFKEIIIMATNCEACGNKTREVKAGSGIGEHGVRITVKVTTPDVLSYDVVKSDTCSVEIPELELELNSSGSGRYTTIEGLSEHIKSELKQANPFVSGDSALPGAKKRLDTLFEKLSNIVGYTIILDDPCGNSYI